MRQIIQSYRTGEMELADVPAPVCDDNGILVRVACSLVSAGTEKMLVDLAKKSLMGKALARPDLARQVVARMKKDGVRETLEKVFTKLDNPIPLGYSLSGKVIAVGSAVSRFQVGDWVACGGAGYANHAEMVYIPQNLAVKLPDGLDAESASFATVGSIAMQGVRQAEVELGHRVGVLGLGLLGQLTVQILKANGAKVVCMDIAEHKMKLALELGADWAVHTDNFVSTAKNVTDGHGLDALIITASTSSNDPIDLAGQVCRYKGKVVVVGMVGMNIPRNDYYRKELDVRLSMSYGPGRYDPVYEEKGIDYPYALVRWTEGRNMQTFVELCAEGKVSPRKLVTHRFDFGDAIKAYSLFEDKAGEPYLGILLKYDMERPVETRVALEVPKTSSAAEMRVGLIGAGNFAKGVLLPALAKLSGVQVEAIATATGISSKTTAEKYRIREIYSGYAELLEKSSANSVLITTRHDLHAPAVLAALEKGCHIFVEKPLCIDPGELEAITTAYAADAGKAVLMVGFNRRFSSHARGMREWIAKRGERPVIRYRINAGFIPRDSWIQDLRVGGGRIIGEACHFVDLCAYLADSDVEEVYASRLETPGEYSGDNMLAILKHANGARSSIEYLANGDAGISKESIEVFCGRGIAVCDDFRTTRFADRGKAKDIKSKGQDKGFAQELAAFREAVLGKTPAPIAFSSLANTTATTFALVASAAEGAAKRV